MTSRKYSAGRHARVLLAAAGGILWHTKLARSRPPFDGVQPVRDSQPFQAFCGSCGHSLALGESLRCTCYCHSAHLPGDGGPAQPGQAVPPTPAEAPPSSPLIHSLAGWMPTVALPDGRLAVRLERLPGFPDAQLRWPVVELLDGSLAVLVSDLWGGLVQ